MTKINNADDQQQTADTLRIMASKMSATFNIDRVIELVGGESESVIRFS